MSDPDDVIFSMREYDVPLIASFIGVFCVAVLGFVYEPGPWWLWTSDACPAPHHVCGQIPIGPVLLVVVGFVFIGALRRGAFRFVEICEVEE